MHVGALDLALIATPEAFMGLISRLGVAKVPNFIWHLHHYLVLLLRLQVTIVRLSGDTSTHTGQIIARFGLMGLLARYLHHFLLLHIFFR